jgi:hypothetical protein
VQLFADTQFVKHRASPIEALESRHLLSAISPRFAVANTPAAESAFGVASDGTNFLATVRKDGVIGAQLMSPDGMPIGSFISTGRTGINTAVGEGGLAMAAFGGS